MVTVRFPNQNPPAESGTGFIITLALIIIVTILGIMGSVIEYVPLLDKRDSDPNDKPEKRLNLLGLAFFSFSFKNNLKKLFEVSDKGDTDLKVLNGIRVLSICWVILGHSFMVVGFPLSNVLTALNTLDSWYFAIIPGSFFSVDVFFFMAGFLTFYLLTAKMHPKKGWTNFPMVYFHRWFRLITPAGFTILLTVFIFEHFGTHPDFPVGWENNCGKHWWSSLLFINTLVPWDTNTMCISWFWYLANDFQFFLISPIIIFAYCKNKYIGYILILLLMTGNFIVNMVITHKYDLGIQITFDNQSDFYNLVYMRPWNRFAPYGVGGIIGFMYFEYKKDQKYEREGHSDYQPGLATKIFQAPKNNHFVTYGSLLAGLFLTTFFVFIMYDFFRHQLWINPWSTTANMLFNAFSRAFFVIGLALIIYPTFTNRLTWIKSFLSSDFMCVVGRLTF